MIHLWNYIQIIVFRLTEKFMEKTLLTLLCVNPVNHIVFSHLGKILSMN